MIIKHLYTDAQKLKWWGEGEWVKEPDEMLFTHSGIDCKIVRVVAREPCEEEHIFGGHLCGYVALPGSHPWWGKKYEEMSVDVHGGLTYGECSDKHWIGFDCMHSEDVIPSMAKSEKRRRNKFIRNYPNVCEPFKNSFFFNPVYRNIAFVEEECRKLADQVIATPEAPIIGIEK